MEAEQLRIAEDLRGLVSGEVLSTDLAVQMYATDASIYELRPLSVVRPRTADDVAAVMRYAAANQLPIHPRGAGTGLAGESLGSGIVIDFARFMRRVQSVEVDSVRVQAGVVHGELNRQLAPLGRIFGPDPAMTNVTTIGGVVSVDGGGSRWLRYGSTRQHVRSMQVVMADGEIVELGTHAVSRNSDEETDRVQRLANGVHELATTHREAIAAGMPRSVVNRSGYALDRVIDEGQVDLAKLVTGSEGTLALVTEVTLATQALPLSQQCALLVFDSLDKAAHCVLRLLPLQPSACDLMDRRHLSLARESDVRYELLIPQAAEAVLLIEATGDDELEVTDRLRQMIHIATVDSRLAAGAHRAHDAEEVELFWSLSRRFVPTLYRMQGRRRPVPCVEDIAVPVAALPVFLRHLQDTLKAEEVTASVFGHAGHGQLHIRPLLDLANPADVRRMEVLASELYERVWLLGGTISGEHGDGLSRTPFLSRQFGPLMNVFRELKRMFDPQGLLNPGKVIPLPGMRMSHNLRHLAAPHAAGSEEPEVVQLDLSYNWQAAELAQATRACNGCGACRTRDPDTRMCPTNRIDPKEEASPRAKANLLRSISTGQLPVDQLVTDELKAVAELCVHCHMCRLECPTNVDVAQLAAEIKASHARTNGLNWHDWFVAHINDISGWAAASPRLSNRVMASPRMRWLLDKMFGLAPGRKFPRLARRTFLRQAARRKLDQLNDRAAHKVAYFVDTYANYYEPRLANHLVSLLEHNGISVVVPLAQQHSAMPLVVHGAMDEARKLAARNVAVLAEAVRRGCQIVTSEPSAALALVHEYPKLLAGDEDAILVAENSLDVCDYLWKLHQQGALRLDFNHLQHEVAYHAPCHVLALGRGTPSTNLLRLVPGLKMTYVKAGCSGMAGTFGMQTKNYRQSLRIGLPLISAVRDGSYEFSTSECSTCRMQLEQGSRKPTVHPLTLLGVAYGLVSPRELRRGDEAKR